MGGGLGKVRSVGVDVVLLLVHTIENGLEDCILQGDKIQSGNISYTPALLIENFSSID